MLLDLCEKGTKSKKFMLLDLYEKGGKSHYSGAICFSFSYNHRSFQGNGNDGYLEIHTVAAV